MTSTDPNDQPAGLVSPYAPAPDARATEPSRPTGISASVGSFWNDRRLRIAAALALAIAWGLVAAWFTPRGPLTTS